MAAAAGCGVELEGHGEAVHFVFADVTDVSVVASEGTDTAIPVAELFFAGDVIDGQHRARMGDLGESFFGLAADTLGGRIGSDEVGVVGFEALQLAHEVVEVGVGDRRLVEDVIEVLVVADLVAEGVDLFLDGVGHTSIMVITGAVHRARIRKRGPTPLGMGLWQVVVAAGFAGGPFLTVACR